MSGNGDVYDYRATGIRFTSIDYGCDKLFWTNGRDNGNGNGRYGELYVIGYWWKSSINSCRTFSSLYWVNSRDVYDHGDRFKGLYGCADGSINTANFINVKCHYARYFMQWSNRFGNVNTKRRYSGVYVYGFPDSGFISGYIYLHGNGCKQLYGQYVDNDNTAFGLGRNGGSWNSNTM
jgi:hypothetical protein